MEIQIQTNSKDENLLKEIQKEVDFITESYNGESLPTTWKTILSKVPSGKSLQAFKEKITEISGNYEDSKITLIFKND